MVAGVAGVGMTGNDAIGYGRFLGPIGLVRF